MATSRFQLYYSAIQDFFDGTQDWDTDPYYIVLLTSSYTPSLTHSTYADVSAFEVTDPDYQRKSLGGKTVNLVVDKIVCDADDVNFGSNVTITANIAVIIQGSPAPAPSASDELVGYMYLNENTSDVSVVNGSFKIAWSDTDGIFFINNEAPPGKLEISSLSNSGAGSIVSYGSPWGVSGTEISPDGSTSIDVAGDI